MNHFIYSNQKNIEQEIGKIEQNRSYHFFSEGKWSMHELLLYLLFFTGPAKVWITTFSISEVAIRSFLGSIDKKLITELNLLIDFSTRKNKLDLTFFANNVVNQVKLANNHSKIILIENDDWKVVVNGSANMSPNMRYEAGVISTIEDIYSKYKVKILQVFETAMPFNAS